MHLSGIAWRRCTVPSAVRASSSLRSAVINNSRRKGEALSGRLSQSSVRPASTLPDVCGLPVVTSSWKAIKSLDEAYTEVSDAPIEEHTTGECLVCNGRALLALGACFFKYARVLVVACIICVLVACTGEQQSAQGGRS